ncbi:MAG: urease accessory UreF family protein [Paracoccaceae bacterium]
MLAQWLSPAFPVGAFGYSHGLERAVATGAVRDGESLLDWLETVLRHGAGRNDALFLAAAYRAADAEAVVAIDQHARAFSSTRERLLESLAQGAAFARAVAAVWGHALPPLAYPVALGRAARLEGLPFLPTSALYLQTFAANLVGAAQRLAPVGQTEGQAITRALAPCAPRWPGKRNRATSPRSPPAPF